MAICYSKNSWQPLKKVWGQREANKTYPLLHVALNGRQIESELS